MIRYIAFFLTLFLTLSATTIDEIVDLALKNENAKNYLLNIESKNIQRDALFDSYLPRIDLSYNKTYLDQISAMDIKESQTVSVNTKFTLFDGFKRENLLKSLRYEMDSLRLDSNNFEKIISLQSITYALKLKALDSLLESAIKKQDQLSSEASRLKRFYEVGKAMKDQIARLESSVALSEYNINSILESIDALRGELEVLTSQKIVSVESFGLREPSFLEIRQRDDLRSKEEMIKALNYKADAQISEYLPRVDLRDSYSYYKRDGLSSFMQIPQLELVDKQNRFMIEASMLLFDFGSKNKERQLLLLESKKAQNSLTYAQRQSQKELDLAKKAMQSSKLKVSASNSMLEAAKLSEELVSRKFKNGLANVVEYLDAISSYFDAIAKLEESKAEYEIKKAEFYYYSGYNPREFLE